MSGEGFLSPRRPLIEAPLEFRLLAGGSASKERALVLCPKCNAPSFIRRSDRLTETVKHLTAHCTNSGCGCIFAAEIVVTEILVPGLVDRPDLNIPVRAREQAPHVLPPSGEGDGSQISMFSG